MPPAALRVTYLESVNVVHPKSSSMKNGVNVVKRGVNLSPAKINPRL